MKPSSWLAIVALLGAGLVAPPADARRHKGARGSAPDRILMSMDKDFDGRIATGEWTKPKSKFESIDTDDDGFLTYGELRQEYGGPEKMIVVPLPKENPKTGSDGKATEALDDFTICAIGRGRQCDMRPAIARGLFQTGLRPRFPDNTKCRDIDEQWAISYTHKRPREAYHGGIDMPAPRGTPMIAVAAGTVVAKYLGEDSARGIEIILRHSPADTGIPLWIYTQYGHFAEMPNLDVGQRVRMGENLGPTGNSGIDPRTRKQSTRRRDAIHFAVFFSTSENFVERGDMIIPINGRWMDPNALYRMVLPLDSSSMKALPAAEKRVPIPVMLDSGEAVPAATKIVWPYRCQGG
jgi:murein DD-endopeptidase MepM/ murein hydrolase activator NlpD